MDFEGEEYARLAYKIHESIWNGHQVYLNLLSDLNSSIRRDAVILLCKFQDHTDLTLPYIRQAISNEFDKDAKEWMIKVCKNLYSDND